MHRGGTKNGGQDEEDQCCIELGRTRMQFRTDLVLDDKTKRENGLPRIRGVGYYIPPLRTPPPFLVHSAS